ncbi:AI-2E family transporter [Altererythrobacter sp. CAU 1778]
MPNSDAPPAKDAGKDDVGNSPTRIDDPATRSEVHKAFIWSMVVGGVILAIYLSQSILVIFGALVLAAMLDGGARLLGRVLDIGRTWRVVIVLLGVAAFFIWLVIFAGTQIAQEAGELPATINLQAEKAIAWAQGNGIAISWDEVRGMAGQLVSGVGTITRAIGGLFGGLTTLLLITIIGIYVALDPRLYERGVAWFVPREQREEFYVTASRMGATLRRLMAGRLLGMVVEGIFTWALLAIYGVPMAALLGLLTGLLAFIPNIGAFVSGVLMITVGFSGGPEMGLYTIFVYVAVQTIDGYILIPMIAKKTVDLAPALVLAAQLMLGVLFGILGLALADPLMAMLKTALERRAERQGDDPAAGDA